MTFGLPAKYRRNLTPVPFDDHAPVTGQCAGWEWQPDVYPHAADRATDLGRTTIIDVGCGAGRKLATLADRFDVTGVDLPGIVDRIDLPGRWVAADFDTDGSLPVTGPALWVCSDVIEHLTHPDRLLRHLLDRIGEHGDHLIISTPDRDRSRWTRRNGPPLNRGHVQEWTLGELGAWLHALGFTIEAQGHTRSNDHEPDLATCLLEVTP